MKVKITKSLVDNFTKAGLFLCVIALIIQLFPRDSKFKYQFEVGKPWSYQLITASFDFPIYKSDAQLSSERNNILKDFTPFFKLDETVQRQQLRHFTTDWEKRKVNKPSVQKYLKNKLESIYSSGIVSTAEYNQLVKTGARSISCILPSRVTHTLAIEDIYTPKSAYEEIVKGAPVDVKLYDINLYLADNLKFDSTTTNLSKKDLYKNLSLTSGMVQSGQRIIDRGEIVTPATYLELSSLKKEYEKRKNSIQQSSIVFIGEGLMILGLISLFFIYVYLFRPRIYQRFGDLLFLSLLIVMIVGMVCIARYYSLNHYMVPFALLPIIIRVFYDARTALFAHIITMLIISFMVDDSFQFLVIQIAIGMAAVSSLKDMTQRSQLAQSAFYIFLCYVVMYLAFQCIAEGDVNKINWEPILYFGISSFLLLFAYVLIYIFEKMFGLISAITLVELTNINNDLMMRFAEVAPGTFQHSLQVSNLCTEAAKKINANSLLVRTGALYHDIGKMNHPEYYIENQLGDNNPLSKMDYETASRIVISHVRDGIVIAKKNHLPEQIINFIGTHHGLNKTKFFYNSFINDNPGVLPNKDVFTYPGPLPNNKETAILMMADAVEARSRSLTEYTEESINEMVESIVNAQIADGQFKDAPITFRDVETVKSVFKEKIKNINHTRIVYPELRK